MTRTEATLSPVVRHTDEAKNYNLGGHPTAVLLSGAETGGRMCLTEVTIGPGIGPPLHVHTREDEQFFVLEGEVTFYVGDQRVVAREGTAVFAPRNSPHRFCNEGATRARMLVMSTPGNFDAFARDAGIEVAPGTRDSGQPDPASIERLVGACGPHGIVLV